jgi:(DL)-glycerol-3-phosphatase
LCAPCYHTCAIASRPFADGVLVFPCAQDTEGFYTTVQQKILERFGKQFTWDLKAKMMGQKALPAARTLVHELGLEGQLEPEDFVKEREEMLHTMFPDCQLLPGAAELVLHLKRNKVRPFDY